MNILDLLCEIRPDVDFTDSKMFIEEGLLDSFDILMLVTAIEDYYHIEITQKDLIPENFESIGKIEEMIQRITQ